MKKIIFTILYVLVLILFIIPPVTVPAQPGILEVNIRLTPFIFFQFAVALLIFFVRRELYPAQETIPVFRKHALVLCGFGGLLLISALFELAGYLLLKNGIEICQSKVILPQEISGWISMIFAVMLCAFNEEVFYRFYLPEGPEHFSGSDKKNYLWETASVLIFALGHRYLGWLGVLNALFCGIILRTLFLKSRSIWITSGVHITYNLLTVIASVIL